MLDEGSIEGAVLHGAFSGKPIMVGRHLGGGGQGDVYVVDYAGEKKALKWFRNPQDVPDALYGVIAKNAKMGSPGSEFIWPIEPTTKSRVCVDTPQGWRSLETFGYVMDLIPSGYYSLKDYASSVARFDSYKVAVDACLGISRVFRILRSRGLCYQDLNAGNFFFEPHKGDVVICDCDNVAANGTSTGVLGTPGFMAPEIVRDDWEYYHNRAYQAEYQHTGRRRVMPSYKTDRFSMGVLFFMLLTLNNPLIGRRALAMLDEEHLASIFGFDALFMFDPHNQDNAPDPVVNAHAIKLWDRLPFYMREVFQRAFSHEAIFNENARVTEGEWIEALVRLRADIIKCPCGSPADLFVDAAGDATCAACGRRVRPPLRLAFANGVRVPALPGTRIYRIQVGPTQVGHELDPFAAVIAHMSNPRLWGMRNLSGIPFVVRSADGGKRVYADRDVVPMRPGLRIVAHDKEIRVERND